MTRANHWECSHGDTVDPIYFSPPLPPMGGPILEVIAFGPGIPRHGWRFQRTALGEPWTRTP